MAKVFPEGWRELAATGAAERELQTLGQLAAGLGDEYAIYHGVHWTRVEKGNYAIVGEIDFAIVGPTGKLLLIEQKSGLLNETAAGLVKKYAGKDKNVAFQMARSAEALHERLARAGVEATEARISHLAYSPEIASAMLQRQQASAIIAARQKIVEGAVGMVENALELLAQKQIMQLDEERKAATVSNLLVVLCGERSPQPLLNTGTLYQ